MKYNEFKINADIEELATRRKNIITQRGNTINELQSCAIDSKRVANIAINSEKIFQEIENEFELQTGLNKIDVSFLFAAVVLQCVRQYIFTNFKERVDHKTADKNTSSEKNENSNRKHRWYAPSLEQVISNPVPFDAMFGSGDFNLGLGGSTHRAKTLGHDPLLGWIFGTANIATSTLTTWDFRSFHIKTGMTAAMHARDKITHNADTLKVFQYTKRKLLDSGLEGKTIIATSLMKEAIHLKSDIGSFAGLPIPVVQTISPNFAQELAKYGLDAANVTTVGKQAAWATLINTIIAMIHRLFYEKSACASKKTYEVKTRKILSYSNLIATGSNIIMTTILAYMGNVNALRKLDIGGILVTLSRLITDFSFMHEVKKEFVFGQFANIIGNPKE